MPKCSLAACLLYCAAALLCVCEGLGASSDQSEGACAANSEEANCQQLQGAKAAWDADPAGYVLYCPCMGRFGNQAEHFLGALAFAKAVNRTLALPAWRTNKPHQNIGEIQKPPNPNKTRPGYNTRNHPYKSDPAGLHVTTFQKNVAFNEFFQVEPLREYHKVITMEQFMEHLAPWHWVPGKRNGYCWQPRSSEQQNDCKMKEGNPFGPFWDGYQVEFDDSIPYYFSTSGDYKQVQIQWNQKFPYFEHPVLAFRGAPASFPCKPENRELHRHLKWSEAISQEGEYHLRTLFKGQPYVGIHLRNGEDWVNACDHAEGRNNLMASTQCMSKGQVLTKDICLPTLEQIMRQTKEAVEATGARHIFVATDKQPLLGKLRGHIDPTGKIQVHHLDPALPQIDLYILGQADHFIGNCVSSFSSFVKRERDVNNKPSSFWAYTPPKE